MGWRKSLFLAGFLLAATDGRAQDAAIDFPVADVLLLAQNAFAHRDGFEAALRAHLPSLQVEHGGIDTLEADPFAWSFGGTFGGAGAHPRPGAIFGCARYGLATRDQFASEGFAYPPNFRLMRDLLPLSDDGAVWPDGAVARLHCMFIWDDVATVHIVDRAPALTALGSVFETVVDDVDPGLFQPVLGEGGFRLVGRNGPGDSVVWMESGDVILTNGHQQVSFRAFLMGGAV